jgi:hypothetical protein
MPAQANLKTRTMVPTLAILDTALDTSIPLIKSRLVAEVCILDWPSCPNGSSFMEGEGSSVLPMNILSNLNFSHGTQMASVALQSNPNLNIVFIRIFGNTETGERERTGISTLVNALNWVNANKDQYNIVAVSASQGASGPVINRQPNTNYCVATPLDKVIFDLSNSGVPVFFPSGNSGTDPRMKNKIEWPACISQSIAVGGVSVNSEIGKLSKPRFNVQSNYDKNLVDLWGEWSSNSIYPGNISGTSFGTSVSTQVIAAKYVAIKAAKPNLSSAQLILLMKSSSNLVIGSASQKAYLFDLRKAING